jgi:hypothetical protein
MLGRILAGLIVIAVLGLAGFWFYADRSIKKEHAPVPVGGNKSLEEHCKIFQKGVEKVGSNLYVVIGYGGLSSGSGLASCSLASRIFHRQGKNSRSKT